MELVFRKYFWLVNLLFLLVAAFLVARTVNVFTETVLVGPPDFSADSASSLLRPLYALPARISAEAFSRVTGIPLPQAQPDIKEPVVSPKADLTSGPVHTSLHVRLLGTTVSTNPKWSFAVIEDTQAHTNDSYMVDDLIQGAKVLEIRGDCSDLVPPDPTSEGPAGCVIILNNNRREYIDDKEGNGPLTHISAPVASAWSPPRPSSQDSGVRALGGDRYQVSRDKLNWTLSHLNEVAMQARIVPAFKNGVATGFKLFSIRPNSIYSKIGIQNGDVIRRINGFEINSPDKALEAYTKLKEANHIEIEVERNGQTIDKQYDIQ